MSAGNNFEAVFAAGGKQLQITANLRHGWRAFEKTYGFFGLIPRLPYHLGGPLRVQLSVKARPDSLEPATSSFQDIAVNLKNDIATCELSQGILKIILNSLIPRHSFETGNQGILLQAQPLVVLAPNRRYNLRCYVTFLGSPSVPSSDQHDWGTGDPLVPGGMIESNRRRH